MDQTTLANAGCPFPSVFGPGGGNSLPLEIGDYIGTTASERYDVIFQIAGTGTGQ
jgi:hypothetical protein